MKPSQNSYRHIPSHEEQEEANAYWALVTVKKWVVEFSRGSGKKMEVRVTYVAAMTKERALAAGRVAAKLCGHDWTSRARGTARLATYRDLGAVRFQP